MVLHTNDGSLQPYPEILDQDETMFKHSCTNDKEKKQFLSELRPAWHSRFSLFRLLTENSNPLLSPPIFKSFSSSSFFFLSISRCAFKFYINFLSLVVGRCGEISQSVCRSHFFRLVKCVHVRHEGCATLKGVCSCWVQPN